jgi:hypothetical protein
MSSHPDRDGDCPRDGWSGDRIPLGARFSAPVQTGTVAQLSSSYALGTGSFTGVKRPGSGVAHSHLEPRLKKEHVIGWNVPLLKASFTRSGFRLAGRFRLYPDAAVEHRRAYAYSHNLVVSPAGNLPAGCRVAAGATYYYAQSPAGNWVNSGADVTYRRVRTLRLLSGCIGAITFHCTVNRVLTQWSLSGVKMGGF